MRKLMVPINQDLSNTILKKDVEVIVERKVNSLEFNIDDNNYSSCRLIKIAFFCDSTVKISGIKSTLNNLNLHVGFSSSASVLGAKSVEIAYKNALDIVERLLVHNYDESLSLPNAHDYINAKIRDIESDLSRMNFYISCLDSAFRKE